MADFLQDISTDPNMLALSSIVREEGFTPTAIPDKEGLAIGFGRHLNKNSPLANQTISKEKATEFLLEDIKTAQTDARKVLGESTFNELSPVRQAVMVNMAYNMGRGKSHVRDDAGEIIKRGSGLKSFENMIAAIKSGETDSFPRAASEILDSEFARELPNRARRMALAFEEDRFIEGL